MQSYAISIYLSIQNRLCKLYLNNQNYHVNPFSDVNTSLITYLILCQVLSGGRQRQIYPLITRLTLCQVLFGERQRQIYPPLITRLTLCQVLSGGRQRQIYLPHYTLNLVSSPVSGGGQKQIYLPHHTHCSVHLGSRNVKQSPNKEDN